MAIYTYKRARRKKTPLLVLLFLILLVIWFFRARNAHNILTPIADESKGVTTFSGDTQGGKPDAGFSHSSKNPQELKTLVKSLADTRWKNYSVVVMSLNSDFVMSLNETAIYDAASVAKIPILVTLYHEVSEGTIDMNKQITIQAKDVQDYGTGSIQYDPPGSVYSIRTLASLMIKKSDNTAAYVLANFVLSLKNIQTYIESLGTTQTDMNENTTSNGDIAILFRDMFAGKIANAALTTEMIGLLKDTDFENRLPAKLPEGAIVYHKIGTGLGGAIHDAGVVQSDTAKYYIGVFTANAGSEEQANADIADLSRAVYDFMQ